ncbi:hypothetical protein DRO33_00555, partial [Candidatus Bathyarchaeota archaeon]
MRIAIVAHNPLDESPGTNYRIIEMARELGQLGVECFILCPYEPDRHLAPGVEVVGLRGPLARAASRAFYGLGRSLLYGRATARAIIRLWTSRALVKRAAKELADTVASLEADVVQGTQDVESLPCLMAAEELGLPFVLDLHNLSSEELLDAGLLRPGEELLGRLRGLERGLLHRADIITPVSEELARYLIEAYGVEPSKIRVVRSGGRPFTDLPGWEEPKRVVHAGVMVYRCWPGLLVRAMALAARERPEARFYTAGKGELLGKALGLAGRLGLELRTYWFEEFGAMRHFLAGSYLGLITGTESRARRFGYPAKLFECMSAGLPVVTNDVGGWTEIVRRERIGLVCPSNARELAKA